MQKIMTSFLVLFSMSVAKADIIECVFTEPFVGTTYSMTQSTLTYTYEVDGTVEVVNNVSFQIKDAGIFELVKDGEVLQTLTLNYQGNNGMSDHVYPYEVQDKSIPGGPNGGIGGCYSNHLPVKE